MCFQNWSDSYASKNRKLGSHTVAFANVPFRDFCIPSGKLNYFQETNLQVRWFIQYVPDIKGQQSVCNDVAANDN